MKTAIVFIKESACDFKAYFVKRDGTPYRLGLWLLECEDDKKLRLLLNKLSSVSYDCNSIDPIELECGAADHYYAYINKNWYVYSSTAPKLIPVVKAMEEQTSFIQDESSKFSHRLKKNPYFEAIRRNIIERELTPADRTAYSSYVQSMRLGYDIVIANKTVEDDSIAVFAETMKKAGVKSFAYPYYNLNEVTVVFSSMGYVRNGFYSYENINDETIRIPEFRYHKNNDEPVRSFWSGSVVKGREL